MEEQKEECYDFSAHLSFVRLGERVVVSRKNVPAKKDDDKKGCSNENGNPNAKANSGVKNIKNDKGIYDIKDDDDTIKNKNDIWWPCVMFDSMDGLRAMREHLFEVLHHGRYQEMAWHLDWRRYARQRLVEYQTEHSNAVCYLLGKTTPHNQRLVFNPTTLDFQEHLEEIQSKEHISQEGFETALEEASSLLVQAMDEDDDDDDDDIDNHDVDIDDDEHDDNVDIGENVHDNDDTEEKEEKNTVPDYFPIENSDSASISRTSISSVNTGNSFNVFVRKMKKKKTNSTTSNKNIHDEPEFCKRRAFFVEITLSNEVQDEKTEEAEAIPWPAMVFHNYSAFVDGLKQRNLLVGEPSELTFLKECLDASQKERCPPYVYLFGKPPVPSKILSYTRECKLLEYDSTIVQVYKHLKAPGYLKALNIQFVAMAGMSLNERDEYATDLIDAISNKPAQTEYASLQSISAGTTKHRNKVLADSSDLPESQTQQLQSRRSGRQTKRDTKSTTGLNLVDGEKSVPSTMIFFSILGRGQT